MTNTLLEERITDSLAEARNWAREFQMGGYGLHDSVEAEFGEEFWFTYVRPSDNATAVVLLIPAGWRNRPGYVVTRCDDSLPMCRRIVSDSLFPNADAADTERIMTYGGAYHEVKPHIDVLGYPFD